MGFTATNDPVAKGPVTRGLDELSVRNDARPRMLQLHEDLRRLADSEFQGLEEVLAKHLFRELYDQQQVDNIKRYLKTNWFSHETGWWPAFQPVAPIYALGLLRTLNASLASKDAPFPIDSYWLIGHDQVQLINLSSQRQVTLLIATPPPPEPATGIQGVSSEAWVTARRAGRTEGEIDPLTEQQRMGGPELRVRTFRIQSRRTGGTSR